MELYEAWQKRRWKKLRPAEAVYRTDQEVVKPRITQADVLRDHDIHRGRNTAPPSRQMSVAGSSHGSIPPAHTPRMGSRIQPEASQKLERSWSLKSKEGSFLDMPPSPRMLREAEGSLGSSQSRLPSLRDAGRYAGVDDATQPESHVRKRSAESIIQAPWINELIHQDPRRQERAKPSILDTDMDTGGTRHILRDFQEQLQSLRGQIGILTSQNTELKRRCSAAESNAVDTSYSRTDLEAELNDCKAQLVAVQGDLKHTRNRELRLERLQGSLKMLMNEKEAKLNNTSLNSRAVVEKTGALQARIEELEAELAKQKGFHEQELGQSEAHSNERQEAHEQEKAALAHDFQCLRGENQELFRKLIMQDALIEQTRHQNAEQQQDLVSRQDELCRAADELNRAEQEMAVLKSEHAHQLGQATKAVDEATAGHTGNEALKGQLESLQSEYQQMTAKLNKLSQERDAAVQEHQAMQADFHSRNQERESLTSTVSEAQKEAQALQSKHKALQGENTQLADTLRACTERHEALLEEHSKAGQDSEAMFHEKQEIQKLMEEALTQLQETQAAKLEIEGQVKGSKQRSDNLAEAVADMTDQVQNFKRRTADLDIQNAGLKTKLEESNTLLAKADKENSVARQKQEDLEISLADSCQQVAFWKGSSGEAERQQKAAEAKVKELKAETSTLQQRQDELVQEAGEAKSTVEQLHTAALAFEDDNKRLSEENSELERLHLGAQDQLQEVTSQHDTLQKQHEQLDASHQAFQTRHKDLQAQHESLGSQLTALQAAESQSRSAHAATQEQLGSLQAKHERLQGVHEEVSHRLNATTAEHSRTQQVCKELHDQVEQLKTACRDLTAELEKGRQENGRLRDANANIVAERGLVANKLGELRTQHSQLQGEHAGLKGQFEELASQRSESAQHLDELEAEHRRLKENHTRVRGQLASAQGSTSILEKQLSSAKADTEGLKDLHAEQVQGLERENAETHRTLAALQAQNEELQESHTQLEGHFQELSVIIEELQKLHEDSAKQASDLEAENEELLKLQTRGQDRAEGMQAASITSHRDIRELQQENMSLRATTAELESQLGQLTEKNRELRIITASRGSDLEKASTELQDLKLRHEQLEAGHLDVTRDLTDLGRAHNEIKGNHASALQELQALTDAHAKQRQQLETVSSDHEALQQAHRQGMGSVVALRAEHDRLSQSYTQSSEALLTLNQQHQELQDRHAAATSEVQSLSEELDSLQHDHARNVHGLTQLGEQHERLQHIHNDSLNQAEALRDHHLTLQQTNTSNERLVNGLRAELSEVNAMRDREQERSAALDGSNRDLYNRTTQLEEELRAAQNKIEAIHSTVDEEQAVTRGVLQEAQQRGVLIDQLKRDLEAATAENDVHRQDYEQAKEAWDRRGSEMKADLKRRKEELKSSSKASSAEIARLKGLLDQAYKNASLQAKRLEESMRSLEAANSEALSAKQNAASLQMDLASALDKQQSASALANSRLEAAMQRQQALEEELHWKEQNPSSLNSREVDPDSRPETSKPSSSDMMSMMYGFSLPSRQNSSTSAILVRDPGTPRSNAHHPEAQSRHVGVKENLNRAKYRVSSLEKQVKVAAMKKLETDIELRTALNTLTPSNQNIPGSPRSADPSSRLQMLHRQHAELRNSVTAALQKLDGMDDSQQIHREVIVRLNELSKLRAQHADLKAVHSALTTKYKEKKAALGAAQGGSSTPSQWTDKDRRDFAERHAKVSEDLQAALDRAARSERLVESQKENIVELNARIRSLSTELNGVSSQSKALRDESQQAKVEAEQLRRTLDGTSKTHQRTVSDLQETVNEMREAPERDHAALSFELWRLVQENDMLRARTTELESDVQDLIENSENLGHANPKQKLQYHMRNKQELEGLRNETTLLLRERFQLEQCIRYLAVRCGLASAVERDVTASKERSPLERLQPASLVPHYKFSAKAAHVTDAAGDHVPLEDLVGDEPGSPAGSDRGSVSTTFSTKPDMAVEQQILSRVAFVCNPPAHKLPANPLRPSLTPGALMALPGSSNSRGPESLRSNSRKSLMSNGSRLQATPLPMTPGQQEGLRARITEPLTPTQTPSENPDSASPDNAEAKELTERNSSLGQASVQSQAKSAGGLTPKEERFARIRDQNERLGKKISRVFSVNRTR